MRIRFVWVAVVATLFVLAAPFAYADGGHHGGGNNIASLNGESLISQEIGQGSEVSESVVTGECNPLGTSEFEFTVTGVSAGLSYPGTFVEEGTLTMSLLGSPTFESTFTIDSPAGTVEGTKSLVSPSLAVCGPLAIPAGGANAISFAGTVSYTATITTPNGSREDSGTAFVTYQDFDQPAIPNFNGHSFSETFTSDDPGGGGDDDDDDDDDHDDDDDDHGGDDDDDD
jgi:hypothetical protein